MGNKIVDHSDVVGASPVGAAFNHIFRFDLTPGFNGLGNDNCKMRRESFKFWGLVHLILEILQYFVWAMRRFINYVYKWLSFFSLLNLNSQNVLQLDNTVCIFISHRMIFTLSYHPICSLQFFDIVNILLEIIMNSQQIDFKIMFGRYFKQCLLWWPPGSHFNTYIYIKTIFQV